MGDYIMVKSSVDVYFELQERYDCLLEELENVKKERQSLRDKVTVDVESVFLAFDEFECGRSVDLVEEGLLITVFVKKFNDYSLVDRVPLELFKCLDDLMDVHGVLFNVRESCVGGNQGFELELLYSLDGGV